MIRDRLTLEVGTEGVDRAEQDLRRMDGAVKDLDDHLASLGPPPDWGEPPVGHYDRYADEMREAEVAQRSFTESTKKAALAEAQATPTLREKAAAASKAAKEAHELRAAQAELTLENEDAVTVMRRKIQIEKQLKAATDRTTIATERAEKAAAMRTIQDKKLIQSIRARREAEERIERATRTSFERIEGFVGIAEGIDTVSQVMITAAQMAAKFGQAMWTAAQQGAALNDLAQNLSTNMPGADEGFFSSINQATGGVLTGSQQQRFALQGQEAGLSPADQQRIAQMAAAAAAKQNALEGGDIQQQTMAAMKDLINTLKTGQAGKTVKDLGVRQEFVDIELQKRADALGISVDMLTEETRGRAALGQAMKKAEIAAAKFSASSQQAAKNVENSFKNLVEEASRTFFKTTPRESDPVSLIQDPSQARGKIIQALREEEGVNSTGSMADRGGSAAQRFRQDLQTGKLDAEIARRMARLIREASNTAEAMGSQQLDQFMQREFNAERAGSAEALSRFADAIAPLADLANDPRFMDDTNVAGAKTRDLTFGAAEQVEATSGNAEAVQLIKETRREYEKQLVAQLGIDQAVASQIAGMTTLRSLAGKEETARKNALVVQRDRLEGRVKFIQQQLKTNMLLSEEERLTLRRELAERSVQRQIFISSTSREEAKELMEEQAIQQRIQIEQERESVKEIKARGDLLLEEEKAALRLRSKTLEYRDAVAGVTGEFVEQDKILAQNIFEKVLENGGEAAKLLREELKKGSGWAVAMRDGLAGGAAFLNQIASIEIGGFGLGVDFAEILAMMDSEVDDEKKKGRGGGRGNTPKDYSDIIRRLRRDAEFRQVARLVEDEARRQLTSEFAEMQTLDAEFFFRDGFGFDVDISELDRESARTLLELKNWYRDTLREVEGNAEAEAALARAYEERLMDVQDDILRRHGVQLRATLDEALGETEDAISAFWSRSEKKWERGREQSKFLKDTAFERGLLRTVDRRTSSEGGIPGLSEADELTTAEKQVEREKRALETWYNDKLVMLEGNLMGQLRLRAEHFLRVQELEDRQQEAFANRQAEMLDMHAQMWNDMRAKTNEASPEAMSPFPEDLKNNTAGGFFRMADMAMAAESTISSASSKIIKNQQEMAKAGATRGQIMGQSYAIGAQAAGRFAQAFIKDEKARAGISAAMEGAAAIAAFARGQVLRGSLHTLAATKYAAIAGGAFGGSSKAEAKKAESTALSRQTVAANRRSVPDQIVNIYLDPIDGRAIVNSANRDARRSGGLRFSTSLTSGRGARTEL